MVRGTPTPPFLAAQEDTFVTARPRDEWTTVSSRRTYLERHILEKHGTTVGCLGCEMRRALTEQCRKRIEQEMVDASEVFLTQRQ